MQELRELRVPLATRVLERRLAGHETLAHHQLVEAPSTPGVRRTRVSQIVVAVAARPPQRVPPAVEAQRRALAQSRQRSSVQSARVRIQLGETLQREPVTARLTESASISPFQSSRSRNTLGLDFFHTERF